MTGEAADAIAAYHDLLTEEVAAESQARLEERLRARGLVFGDRPVCTVIRPRFMSPERYRLLQRGVRRVMGAFRRAHDAAMADAGLRAQFALEPWEERLIAADPGFSEPSPVSRLDAFFVDGDRLRFTEYNAETPAGGAYNDALSTVFYGLQVMRRFLRRWDARPLPSRHNVLQVLLDAWEQFSGRFAAPAIAILDWREVPTYSEFLLFREYFRDMGLACEIVDPREVEYRGGRLRAGDFAIDLVYKRVLLSELVARGGEDHPVLRAVKDRAVCMVNPVRCKLLHKKTSLAVLSDERNAGLFDAEQRQAIEAHIPWTRLVEERGTTYAGKAVDLVPFMLASRERLVLKPSDDYGGAGIVLGWEVDGAAWEAGIRKALGQPFIVQERIVLPFEPYPALVN
ncbi:MAG TPA: hypothetical protein VEB59_01300, partial [Gemmatimonadales bacterium]|nr:hypothetical protein [Gemmatimonadales bacterium]